MLGNKEQQSELFKMGLLKDCESCKEQSINFVGKESVLDKIRAEISKAWYTQPRNRYQEGLKDQALKDMKIIDKYKVESEVKE